MTKCLLSNSKVNAEVIGGGSLKYHSSGNPGKLYCDDKYEVLLL